MFLVGIIGRYFRERPRHVLDVILSNIQYFQVMGTYYNKRLYKEYSVESAVVNNFAHFLITLQIIF